MVEMADDLGDLLLELVGTVFLKETFFFVWPLFLLSNPDGEGGRGGSGQGRVIHPCRGGGEGGNGGRSV